MKKIDVYRQTLVSGRQNKDLLMTHCFKVCTVLKGGGIWQIGDENYRVSQDDIILLGAGDKRAFREINKDEMVLLSISFDPELLFGTPFLPLFTNRPRPFSHVIRGAGGASWILEEIINEKTQRYTEYETAIVSLLFLLLTQIKRHCEGLGLSFQKMSLSPKMIEVLNYINENYDKEIRLSAAAAIMPMSESAFSKYFSKFVGTGFIRYVNQKRIEKAVRLLEQTDETVLAIALSCGFNNTVNFYKAFLQITGCTPSSFRKNRIQYL